MTAGQYR